jgi:hypothetical protein
MPKPDKMRAIALDAIRRGYQPIPIREHLKKPLFGGWQHIEWEPGTTAAQWDERIALWGFDADEPYNLGVNLGPISGGLADIDLDDPKAKRFRDLLPRTTARGGRPGSVDSHYWYMLTGDNIPSTRRYTLADKSTVTIEFRYDRGVQTVIPPSDWVPKDWDKPEDEGGLGSNRAYIETRNWSREPWGGKLGPTKVSGRQLAVQVALIALGCVLIDNWPRAGGRHEAYLALAGCLLKQADGVVHPFWERNAAVLIRAIADATRDDDGPDARESESIPSTIKGIRDGKPTYGFPQLEKILGADQITMARSLIAEVESLAGFVSRQAGGTPLPPAPVAAPAVNPPATPSQPVTAAPTAPNVTTAADSEGEGADGEPMEPPVDPTEALGTWGAIDLDPYLSGLFKPVEPTVLQRDDGRCLFYPGRLNMLFAPSESGKTLIALYTCIERMSAGERAVFIDLEDEPVNTIERLRAMGAADDDLRYNFTYIRPDGPVAAMQRDKWGTDRPTDVGATNARQLAETLEQFDPTLIIVDGMTTLYGLHGLDSNNSVETDVITSWLKSLSREGRTTVIIIDHMAKASPRGSMPIGSQHKVSMVQGSLIQVWPVDQPILGRVGKLELIVLKDRPGQVRRYAGKLNEKAQLAATLSIDSTGFYDNGSTKTIVTLASPPPDMTGPVPPALQKIVVDASKISDAQKRKAEQTERMNALFYSAFGNQSGVSLSGPEIIAKIGVAWRQAGFSITALQTTRNRLVAPRNGGPNEDGMGWLLKTGGGAGAKVRYVSTWKTADPDD